MQRIRLLAGIGLISLGSIVLLAYGFLESTHYFGIEVFGYAFGFFGIIVLCVGGYEIMKALDRFRTSIYSH